jgi:hypothetical protein
MSRIHRLKILFYIFYLALLATISFYAKKMAYYDMDLVFYTGCVLEPEEKDDASLQHSVYTVLQRDLPPQNWKRVTDSTNSYRHQLVNNPSLYHHQLIFYRVKPLYIQLLRMAWRAGYSPVVASVWLNVICYFLTGIVLLMFLQRHLKFTFAFVTSVCTMLWPMVLDPLRNNTPDMLGVFLFITGTLLLISEKNKYRLLALPFLVLLIFVRVESVVFILALSGLLWFFAAGRYSKTYLLVLIVASTAAACYVSFTHPLSWSLLYRHSMLGYVADLTNRDAAMTFKEYWLAFKSVPRSLFVSDFSLIILMLFFLVWKRKALSQMTQILTFTIIIYLVCRIFLLPDLCIRYYSGVFILVLVLSVKSFAQQNGFTSRSATIDAKRTD